MVQNTTNESWSKQRVKNKLATQMRTAFDNVYTLKDESEDVDSLREAAYTHAIATVLRAEEYRGNTTRT